MQDLLYDPQTSGGLLMAVAPEDADALLAELKDVVPSAQRIGEVGEYRGGKRILLAIALTALVTGLVLWFFFPNSALMGASGVVFMLIVLASFAGMRTGTIPLTLILVLILYLGSEIFQALTGTAGLAQLTHIAGGVLGMIFGFTWSRGQRAVR